MNKTNKDNIIFSAIFTLVVLWQMLLPGYVLTLDMAMTPKINLNFAEGAFYNALPVRGLFWFLNLFLTGWIVQKLMMIALFFLLFYLAVRFLPVPKKYYANYWGALFYAMNPFVYERFLAGHWTHLIAYAFLPPFFHYVLEFFGWGMVERDTPHPPFGHPLPFLGEGRKGTPLTRPSGTLSHSWERGKSLGWLLFWTLMIGMFSLHFLVMAVLIIAVSFLIKFIANAKDKKQLFKIGKQALILGGLFLVLSSYWIVPYVLNRQGSYLNTFNRANQLAFKTVGANGWETTANVLTLYGFWGEREAWSGYFLSPKDNIILWSVVLALLFCIIIVGVVATLLYQRKLASTVAAEDVTPPASPYLRPRRISLGLTKGRGKFLSSLYEPLFFLLVGFVAFVLSCGLGEGIFKGFNTFLFDHIGFWRGFRDTQKFSGLLALSYVYFGAWGFIVIIDRLKNGKARSVALFILFAVPTLYAYPMVGGFARQLAPVWYPDSWYKAKVVLDSDKSDYKVLFLPWHQYLSLDFDNKIIVSNPSKNFFGTKIVSGDNMEVGEVFSQSTDKENLAIQNIILDQNKLPDDAVAALKQNNIKYILVMSGIINNDYLKYPLLNSGELDNLYTGIGLVLYKIKSYN
jgi:hypothetical protein